MFDKLDFVLILVVILLVVWVLRLRKQAHNYQTALATLNAANSNLGQQLITATKAFDLFTTVAAEWIRNRSSLVLPYVQLMDVESNPDSIKKFAKVIGSAVQSFPGFAKDIRTEEGQKKLIEDYNKRGSPNPEN